MVGRSLWSRAVTWPTPFLRKDLSFICGYIKMTANSLLPQILHNCCVVTVSMLLQKVATGQRTESRHLTSLSGSVAAVLENVLLCSERVT